MGVSVGVEGVNSSGTFGGYIFETTTMKRYGLTNGHVTAMHLKQGASALPIVVQEADGVKMVQNSHQDHLREVERVETTLKDWVAKDELYSGGNPKAASNRTKAAAKVETLKKRNRNFGKVKLGEVDLVDAEGGPFKCWKDLGVIDVCEGENSLT